MPVGWAGEHGHLFQVKHSLKLLCPFHKVYQFHRLHLNIKWRQKSGCFTIPHPPYTLFASPGVHHDVFNIDIMFFQISCEGNLLENQASKEKLMKKVNDLRDDLAREQKLRSSLEESQNTLLLRVKDTENTVETERIEVNKHLYFQIFDLISDVFKYIHNSTD